MLRKSQRAVTEEPSYMRTARFDGRRSVDLEEFVKDERVRNQLKRLADGVRRQKGRRAS